MGRTGAGRGTKRRAPKDAETAAARSRSGRGQRLSGTPLSTKSLSSKKSPVNKGRKTKKHSPSEDLSHLSKASARHHARTKVHEQALDDSDEIATQQSFTKRPITLILSPSDSDNDDREGGSDVRASSNGKRQKLSGKLSRTVTSGRTESPSRREATQSTSHGRKDSVIGMASCSGGPTDGRGIRWKGPEMTNLAARLVEAILADEHRELREGLFGSRNHRAGQQAAKDLKLDRNGCLGEIAEIIRGDMVVERREAPGTGGTVPVFVSVENSVEKRPFYPERMYPDLFPEINPSALPAPAFRVNGELVSKILNTLKENVVIAYNSAARSGRNGRDTALIYSEGISGKGDLGPSDTLKGAKTPTYSQLVSSDAGDRADARKQAKYVEEFHASSKHVGSVFRSDLIAYVVHIASDADEPSRQALAREVFALQWPRRHSGNGSSSLLRDGESGLDAELARLVHEADSTLRQHSVATTPSSAGQLELATMNALPIEILNYLQIVEKTNSLQRDLRESGNIQGSSRIAKLQESVMNRLNLCTEKLKSTESQTMPPFEDHLERRSPSDYGSDMGYT